MSRSSYRETTTEDRDYEDRRERERERARSSDRYDDSESRHHGKWTASNEAELTEGKSHPSLMRRLSRKESRDRSDRDDSREHRRSRSREYDSNSGYGNIPTPPPMPPTDYYAPHSTYRNANSNGYGSHYNTNYGTQQQHGMGSYGMAGYGNHYSTRSANYGTGYHPSSYGHQGYAHPSYASYHQASYPSYGHTSYGYADDYYGQGYGQGAYGHPAYGQGAYGHGAYGSSQSRGVHPIHQAFLSQQHQGAYGQHQGAYGQHGAYGQGAYGHGAYGSEHSRGVQGVHPIHQAFLAQGGHPHLEQRGTRSRSGSLTGLSGLNSEYRGTRAAHPYEKYELHGFHMPRPHSDIYELGNDYIIELDLPGHTRDHVDIKLSGNELYVISKPPARDFNWHINERWLGRHNVERKFYLPADVNTAAIAPVLANGVLRLTLPRHTAATSATAAAAVHGRTTTTNDTTTTTTSTTQAVTL